MAPRRDFAMVQLIDGEILMIGGSNDNGALATTQMLKLATTEWYSSRSLTQARSFPGAIALADGRVLVTGGAGPLSSTEIAMLAGGPP